MFRHVVFVWMALVCLYLTIDFSHAFAIGKGEGFLRNTVHQKNDSAEMKAYEKAGATAFVCAGVWAAQFGDKCGLSLQEPFKKEIEKKYKGNPTPKISRDDFQKYYQFECADQLECNDELIGKCACTLPGCTKIPRNTGNSLCENEIRELHNAVDCVKSPKLAKCGSSFIIVSGAIVVFGIMIIVSVNSLFNFQQ